DEVGHDVLVLDREPAAGPAHAALDLVGDEHDVVLGAKVDETLDEPRRRDDEAALALDRLEDDRGHVVLADVLVDLFPSAFGAPPGAPPGAPRAPGAGG